MPERKRISRHWPCGCKKSSAKGASRWRADGAASRIRRPASSKNAWLARLEAIVHPAVRASRDAFLRLIDKSKADGCDAVILGCTEICLLLDPDTLPLPGFDSTAIHAAAAVDYALAGEMKAAAE